MDDLFTPKNIHYVSKYVSLTCSVNVGDLVRIDPIFGIKSEVCVVEDVFYEKNCQSLFMIRIKEYSMPIDVGWVVEVIKQS